VKVTQRDEEDAMNTKRVALGVAVGAVAVGALALPALAGAGPGPFGPTPSATQGGMGPGYGPGGTGMGMGGTGMGSGWMRSGGPAGAVTCPRLDGVAQGTLTPAQKTTLQSMAEEEKLAGDLYQAFADRYPAVIFDRIGAAEDQHLAVVRALLTRYGLSDPTSGKAAGQFATASVQATYDRLLTQGQAGQTAALSVGQQMEQASIAALQQAAVGLEAPDAVLVYQHLLTASQHHLAMFVAWPAS
jgi:hypothetical protein